MNHKKNEENWKGHVLNSLACSPTVQIAATSAWEITLMQNIPNKKPHIGKAIVRAMHTLQLKAQLDVLRTKFNFRKTIHPWILCSSFDYFLEIIDEYSRCSLSRR